MMTVIELSPGCQHVRDNCNGIDTSAADSLAGVFARCGAYTTGNKVGDVAHHSVAFTN